MSPISALGFSDQVRWIFQRRHDDQCRPEERSFNFRSAKAKAQNRAANNAHSFSATQSATPSTFGAHQRRPRSALKTLFLLGKLWCCRRGLNSRPLPYQQQGAELQETPWGNVLLWLAFSEPVSASTVKYHRVPPKAKISATPALPRAWS